MPVTGPLSKPKKTPPAKAIVSKYATKTPAGTTPVGMPTTASIIPTKTAGQYKDEGPVTSTQGNISAGGGSGGGSAGSSGTMPGGYTPENYNAAFWSNPDALAQDFLSTNRGINNPQLTNEFAPTVDALQLLTSFLGSDAVGELLSASGQASQMNDYMNQITTPGGQALDPSAIMAALANADPNSAAGMAMSKMSPDDVANIAMQLVSAAGGNPFQMRGLQAGFEQGARDYNIDYAKGAQGEASRPYWQGLNQGPLASFFGG